MKNEFYLTVLLKKTNEKKNYIFTGSSQTQVLQHKSSSLICLLMKNVFVSKTKKFSNFFYRLDLVCAKKDQTTQVVQAHLFNRNDNFTNLKLIKLLLFLNNISFGKNYKLEKQFKIIKKYQLWRK